MNEFNTYEYAVRQKTEGKWRLFRVLMIAGYVFFVFLWFVFGAVTKFWPLLAFIPISLWMLVFFTWRYLNVEYEYSITSGVLSYSKIFGNRSRKLLLEVAIKDMVTVAPYNTENRELTEKADEIIARFAPQTEYRAISSESSPDVYYALFKDREADTHCILWFEATEAALRIFKFYNAPATTVTKVRY